MSLYQFLYNTAVGFWNLIQGIVEFMNTIQFKIPVGIFDFIPGIDPIELSLTEMLFGSVFLAILVWRIAKSFVN